MKTLKELLSKIDPELLPKQGNVTETDVSKAEKALNSDFGPQLKEYLLTYGSISYKSVELYGLGFSDNYYLNIIQGTKELRDMGLPAGFYPIFDIGDGHYAVVSKDDHVYEWAYHEAPVKRVISQSLNDYIVELLKNS